MHEQKSDKEDAPTTTSGIGAMYTNNQSWLAGAFHDGYYFDDFMRLRLAAGYGEFHLKFFGVGNDSLFRDNPLKYSATTSAFMPRVLFELPWERFYLGAQYLYVGLDNTIEFSSIHPVFPDLQIPTNTAGLGLVGVFDSRDNNMWPRRGAWLELTATSYDEKFGGSYDYEKVIAKWAQYFPVLDPLVVVYRLDGQFISGSSPFWDLAQIKLRGLPFGRYSDENALTAQAEARWNIYKKWTLLAFGGGGRIANSLDGFGSAPTHWSGGAGVRYDIGGDHKLNVGIDVAYAEGNVEVYFQVGDWLAN